MKKIKITLKKTALFSLIVSLFGVTAISSIAPAHAVPTSRLSTLAVNLTSPASMNSPRRILGGGGYIWVASDYPATTLYQLNSSDGTLVRTITLSDTATKLAYGAGALWTLMEGGNLAKVNPASGAVAYVTGACPGGYGHNGGLAFVGNILGVSCFWDSIFETYDASASSPVVLNKVSIDSLPGGPVSNGSYFFVVNNGWSEIEKFGTDASLIGKYSTPMYYNDITEYTADSNYIYDLNHNTNTQARLTRFNMNDNTSSYIAASTSGYVNTGYFGIASNDTTVLYSLDLNQPSPGFFSANPSDNSFMPAIATSSPRDITWNGSNFWGITGGKAVRYAVTYFDAQTPLTLTVTPNSKTGSPYTLSTSISATGGSGTIAYIYSIDSSSTATGCTLDSTSAPTTVSATTAGTCVIKVTNPANGSYTVASQTAPVTFYKLDQAPLSTSVTPSASIYPYTATITMTTTGGTGTGAITYSIDNTKTTATSCRLNNASNPTTLTAVSFGDCAIKATKAADANYLAATATTIYTFSRADQTPLTLTLNPVSANISGNSPFTQSVTFTSAGGSGTGAKIYSVNPVLSTAYNCRLNSSTAPTTITANTAGTCIVNVTKNPDINYKLAYASAIFTFNKNDQAPLSLALSVSSVRPSGATPYVQSDVFTPSGGSGTGALTYSIDASSTATGCLLNSASAPTSISAASSGTCVIKVTKAGDANFNPTSAFQTFEFGEPKADQTPITLTLSPNNAVSPYSTQSTFTLTGGSGTGAVTYTIDAANSTATGCSINTSTNPPTISATSSGTCAIKVTNAGDFNYLPSSAESIFTFDKADQLPLTLTLGVTEQKFPYSVSNTFAVAGGSGTGAITYSIDSSSTATGCQLDSAIAPTTITATGAGTCVVLATKAGDVDFNDASDTDIFTFIEADQSPITLTVSPYSVQVTGNGPYSNAITPSFSGGNGSGSVTYSIDTANSTATGCTLNDPTNPTSISATSSGQCVLLVTKADDGNYLVATDTAIFTFELNNTSQPGAPTAEAILTQPNTSYSGQPLTTQPRIEIIDQNGNHVPSYTGPVTVTIKSGSGTLIGTTTVSAVVGTATFSGLGISGTGVFVLEFSAPNLAPVDSDPITINPAPTPPPAPPVTNVPDPVQTSSITSSPTECVIGTVFTVTGNFDRTITHITVNGNDLAPTNWSQTATSVQIILPAGTAGTISIQIYNGAAPLLKVITCSVSAPAVPTPPTTSTGTASSPSTPNAPTPPKTTPSEPVKTTAHHKALTVHFAADSSVLTAPDEAELLSLFNSLLGTGSEKITITITGWAQPIQGKVNEKSISLARAKAVETYLKSLGLSARFVLHAPGSATSKSALSRRATVVATWIS